MNKLKLYLSPCYSETDYLYGRDAILQDDSQIKFIMVIEGEDTGRWHSLTATDLNLKSDKKYPRSYSKWDAMTTIESKLSDNYDIVFCTQEQFDRLQVLV